MRIIQVILVTSLMVIIGACSSTDDGNEPAAQNTETTAMYRTMSVDELADIMADDNRAYTVVNVHIPYQGEIEGTDANIAFNNIDALTEALPDKDAPIILYCRSGNMSDQAMRDMVDLGYTQVYDVPGGMNAWRSTGRPLVDNQ